MSYWAMFRKWLLIARGRSYFHVQQGVGRFYERQAIRGYYNDLRRKAEWDGLTDRNGVPLNRIQDGEPLYFPIMLTQFALGHYDCWLETGNQRHWDAFVATAETLLGLQDPSGGWQMPPLFGARYSAMAQGQAVSVLCRYLKSRPAHEKSRTVSHSDDDSVVTAIHKAVKHMISPIQAGGTLYTDGNIVTLEEYATLPSSAVLNGWIFALFGLHDYLLCFPGMTAAGAVLANSVDSLSSLLPRYERHGWSLYSLSGQIASPFYHGLHVALLEALSELTALQVFRCFAERWKESYTNRWVKTWAVARKAIQKLRDPDRQILQ